MTSFEFDGFLSFTLAIILLFIGKGLTSKSAVVNALIINFLVGI